MTASGFQFDHQHLRIDPLTGVGNPLAFFEWLHDFTDQRSIPPFTLLSLDIINLKLLNENHGHAAGDAAVRWATLVLIEEAEAKVYRISGDEFVGVLSDGSPEEHEKLGERVYRRLGKEANLVKLDPPGASLGVIHFSSLERISPEDVLGVIYGALVDVKADQDQTFKVFDASATKTVIPRSGLINDMIRRMVSLGAMLDRSNALAYSDSISGLPNMLAALERCELMIQDHEANNESFSLLLVDGDDLSKYNKIGYLAGDEMIARLAKVLSNEMRPGDFVARWRSGDEFLILLNKTEPDQAASIGNRLCVSVMDSSRDWTYPITISVGVAGFPGHGKSIAELIDAAERSLSQAKDLGKNQVCLIP